MMRLSFILLSLIAVSLIVSACAPNNCGGDFENIAWKLKEYGTPGSLQLVQGNTDITLKFESNEKQINGSGGCNSYFGSYSIDSNCRLKITELGATERACLDPTLMQQEQNYFNILLDAEALQIEGEELHISGSSGVLVYTR
jgi:heat shock protein HslJ